MKYHHAILPVLLAGALSVTPAVAKKLYKYQDEQGVWHYSDAAPDTERPVQTSQVKVDPSAQVVLDKRGPDHNPEYLLYNAYYGPIAVTVRFEQVENFIATPALPHTFVLGPREQRRVFTLAIENSRIPRAQYRLGMELVLGDPATRPAEQIYRPPVPSGRVFRISQAFFGPHSHNGPGTDHAVDIPMPVGTPVVAARAGIVMDVARDFFGNGRDMEKYGTRANHVRILHDDGTMAVYAHLALEGVHAIPGQRVTAGQVIALSGNTGYSTGPHLHFVVQRNRGDQLLSVPFQFRHADGRVTTPQIGEELRGF